jgi:serine/threonine protein kinase
MCGTPVYFAPEVITGEGHSYSVDWWCLGVFIHELFTGHSPFEDDDTDVT